MTRHALLVAIFILLVLAGLLCAVACAGRYTPQERRINALEEDLGRTRALLVMCRSRCRDVLVVGNSDGGAQ